MKESNARVPHHDLGKEPVHITYRLAGSLPTALLKGLQTAHQRALAELNLKARSDAAFTRSGLHDRELFLLNAKYELELDASLHQVKTGPFYLRQSTVAQEIIDSWKFLHEREEVYVYSVCVMSNHVHALVRAPEDENTVAIGALINRHKAHTARVCNKLLGRTGKPFWDRFYFDRTVRTGKFERVMWYVLNNPVQAGLVKDWRAWPNTYLNPEFDAIFRTG